MPKKKNTWVSRLKKKVQRHLKGRHSLAGKRYLKERKKGTTVKQIYRSIKQDNPQLSDKDALQMAKRTIGRISQERGFRQGKKWRK